MKKLRTYLLALFMLFSAGFVGSGCDALLVFLNEATQVDNTQNSNDNQNTNQDDDGSPTSKGKTQQGG